MKFFYLFLFFIPVKMVLAQNAADLAQANSFASQQHAAFEENKGQVWNTEGKTALDVKYHYHQKEIDIFMQPTGLSYQFTKIHYPAGYKAPSKERLSSKEQKIQEDLRAKIRTETYRMDMELVNANPNATIIADGKSKDYVQYYNRDALNVHSFKQLRYQGIYPGIDWVIYTTEQGLKYDFIVEPGADPKQIQIQFTHHEDLKINEDGSFTLSNRMGSITEQAPISFQGDQTVSTTFKLEKNILSFDLSNYDDTKSLTIDPSLIWATYYGGSGVEYGNACVVDGFDNFYLAGSSQSTNNISSGGHQNIFSGGAYDAMIIKFNSTGVRQWATYYGGPSFDAGYTCTVDGAGNPYLAGTTQATSTISHSTGHQSAYGGGFDDAFIVKFNSAGTRLWGSYYGGQGRDLAYGCTVDGADNVYAVGWTTSTNSTSIASGGHQGTYGGGSSDAFIVKFDSIGTRLWGSYYGGSGRDDGNACAVDGADNLYLVGITQSPTSTNIASGGHQNSASGYSDAFVAKFNSTGTRLWSSYYGGASGEDARACVVDGADNLYLVGITDSPTSTAVASGGHQNTFGGFIDAFIVKFNSAGIRLWSSYYGGNNEEAGVGAAVDLAGNIYLSGSTRSTSDVSFGGYQNNHNGDLDAFIVKFTSTGNRLWASYYGGSGEDENFGCATDVNGSNVYLVGRTGSSTNISSGGHQNIYNGSMDAFVAKLEASSCPFTTGTDPITVCNSYTWRDGITYTESNNTATVTLTNAAGCDSILVLDLTVNRNSSTDTITLCDVNSYTWIDGIAYTSSNDSATFTLTNAAGCDSVITLNLTLKSSSVGIQTITACNSYTWIDGNTYTSSNNSATFILPNTIGCDSIISLDLTINNSYTATDTIITCDSHIWIDGNTYTSSNNSATFILNNTNGCDSIISLDLTINNSSTRADIITACNSYTWIDGNTYTSSSNGSATVTLTNSVGCDSIISLYLTMNTVNTSAIIVGNSMKANATGVLYQWLNCDSSYAIVPGATGQSFTPSNSNNYAVEVTQNACVDTSACLSITTVGLNDLIVNDNINIYPNPTTKNIHIDFGKVEQDVSLKLYSADGKLIQSIAQVQGSLYQLELPKTTGIYVLEIKTDKGISHYKIIKE